MRYLRYLLALPAATDVVVSERANLALQLAVSSCLSFLAYHFLAIDAAFAKKLLDCNTLGEYKPHQLGRFPSFFARRHATKRSAHDH